MKSYVLLTVFILLTFCHIAVEIHAQCPPGFSQVDVGTYNTLAVKEDGTLWSWGLQIKKRPSDNSSISSIPVQIGDKTNWKLVGTSKTYLSDTLATSYGITSNGELWTWAWPDFTVSQDPVVPIRIAPDKNWLVADAWGRTGLAVASDGRMYYAGKYGTASQLGVDTNWVFVTAGNHTVHGIKKDGSLWGFGGGRSLQIGNGGDYDQSDFVPVASPPGKKWRMAVDGSQCSFAISENGELWAWGRNNFGTMGIDGSSSTPVRVGTDSNWVSVDAAITHSVGMTSDGKIWAWGNNADGQLGDGTTTLRKYPTQIGKTEKWKAISASGYRTVAITEDGRCWAWGRNSFILGEGILGDGSNVVRTKPTLVGSYGVSSVTGSSMIEHNDVSYVLDGNCDLLARIESTGSAPVAGSITTKVWIENQQPAHYVKRHFELTPAVNPAGASGRVTLFFTQEDFDSFNAVNAIKLPTGKADLQGRANLFIEKNSGVSSDGSGMPDTYGASSTIDPADADVVWNDGAARWEVTFNVAGFSGFFVKTNAGPLPVTWLNVIASVNQENQIAVEWKVLETSVSSYEIQRSTDARNFTTIRKVAGTGDGLHTYTVYDPEAFSQHTYYRIKQNDFDGSVSFSKIIAVDRKEAMQQLNVYPVPAKNFLVVEANATRLPDLIITLIHTDGKFAKSMELHPGKNEIDISDLDPGVYIINTSWEQSYRFVKE